MTTGVILSTSLGHAPLLPGLARSPYGNAATFRTGAAESPTAAEPYVYELALREMQLHGASWQGVQASGSDNSDW